jgi:hypothetical protein
LPGDNIVAKVKPIGTSSTESPPVCIRLPELPELPELPRLPRLPRFLVLDLETILYYSNKKIKSYK